MSDVVEAGRAKVAEADTKAEQAEFNVNQAKVELRAAQGAAGADVEQAEFNVKQAEVELRAARDQLKEAREELAKAEGANQ